MITKLTPETLLRRKLAAQALSENGFPVKASTLATLACRGGGPRFRLFGRVPLYKWSDLLDWAEGRCTPVMSSSSERAAERAALGEIKTATAQVKAANAEFDAPMAATANIAPEAA
jgi:hypothetical protein